MPKSKPKTPQTCQECIEFLPKPLSKEFSEQLALPITGICRQDKREVFLVQRVCPLFIEKEEA